MRIHPRETGSSRTAVAAAALTAAILAVSAVTAMDAQAGPKASAVWRSAAANLRTSVAADAKGSYFLARARALGLTSPAQRAVALDLAKEEYDDELQLAKDQYKARLDLAVRLDESELYRVDIVPANFVAVIDNPFLPFTPGTTWTYRAVTDEGTETIVVTVLPQKKTILGVSCTVVRDTVSIGGQLVEDTLDWYAQDTLGNVWYFGEIALNYQDGDITDVDGSWQGGVDGAQPGIIMPATPVVGNLYRQEFYLGEAEDYGEVLALNASVTVPNGSYTNCLETLDGTPAEPDAIEHKFYARGVGLVLELDPESGERAELISVTVQ